LRPGRNLCDDVGDGAAEQAATKAMEMPMQGLKRRGAPALLIALGAVVVGAASCGGGPEVCSTGSTWDEGDEGSELMHPGGNCIACHAEEEDAPRFLIAGTVMAAFDDDMDCNGVEGVSVVLTGVTGQVTTLTTNAAGNFFLREGEATIDLPYTAKVVYQGRERAMTTPQSSRNCAACHTESGLNGAPGRIVVP
jgi:mono/diheme cytochrome c family protein